MVEILVVLIAAVIFSQQFLIHKLTNKIMSRNYYDYEVTQAATATQKSAKTMPKIPVSEENEDLGYLNS
jgi:hypothetical protein